MRAMNRQTPQLWFAEVFRLDSLWANGVAGLLQAEALADGLAF